MKWLAAALGAAAVAVLVLTAWQPWRPSQPAIRAPSGAYPPSAPAARALVWAVGDGADGGAAARAVAARIARSDPDRVLYLGDVYGPALVSAVRGDGTASDFRTRFHAVYRAFADRIAPTPGNHEWPQRADGYEPYWARIHGSRPPAYYAFRLAGWQLLSLNTEIAHGPGSAQLRWLRARTRAAGSCRLGFWHRPRFSAGAHGDAPDVAPLWNALRGRAALVISGHEHNMQRLRPIDGIAQYVSGAGGHGHYRVDRDARVAFADDRRDGALRIVLRPRVARLAFVTADGRVLDRSVVRCAR